MSTSKLRVSVVLALVIAILVSVQPTYAANPMNHSGKRIGPGGGSGGMQLTQAEIDGLLFMREEEKLARDAYLTLYNKWELYIFSRIASSEANHMAAIKNLLDKYGLADPAAGNPVGVFTNPILQQMYNDLMVRGSQSPTEALRVGVTIEEVDIADLQKNLTLTNKSDIQNVFGNLLSASYNHLSAFTNQLGP